MVAEDRMMLKKKQLDSILNTVTLFHSSLDVHTIMQYFAHHLKKHIEYDSLSYHHPVLRNRFMIGKEEKYTTHFDLAIEKRTLGQITFTRARPFKKKDTLALEEQLSLLINPLKNAISHHQALHAALHDPLTTLLNRGSLPNTLQREMQLAERHNKKLSIIMLDIDDFKKINDKHGHVLGDQVLSQTALIIQTTIRETDYAFRIGGEEFLILLVNSPEKGAKLLAERLRKNIENVNLPDRIKSLPKITASLGLTTYNPKETQQSLISRADKAMYQAKSKGKNKVIIANT